MDQNQNKKHFPFLLLFLFSFFDNFSKENSIFWKIFRFSCSKNRIHQIVLLLFSSILFQFLRFWFEQFLEYSKKVNFFRQLKKKETNKMIWYYHFVKICNFCHVIKLFIRQKLFSCFLQYQSFKIALLGLFVKTFSDILKWCYIKQFILEWKRMF